MFVADDELLFPYAGPEAFRARLFGKEFVSPLTNDETARMLQMERELLALRVPLRGFDVPDIVKRHFFAKVLRGDIESFSVVALNSELSRNRNSRTIFLSRAEFPLLNRLANETEVDLAFEVAPLRAQSAACQSQRAKSDAQLRNALLKGALKYWMVCLATGVPEAGMPDFWRSNSSNAAWDGQQFQWAGLLYRVMLRTQDLESYFHSLPRPANDAEADSASVGEIAPTAAAERRAERALRASCVDCASVESNALGTAHWPKAKDWREEAPGKFGISARGAERAWRIVAGEYPALSTPRGKKKARRY